MTNPKIIMAVGATNLHPYPLLIVSAQRTWDSVKHPNFLDTVYFYGGDKEGQIGLIQCEGYYEHYTLCEETVGNEALKFVQMFKDVWHLDWDFLVAGSTSSYWDKARLFEKVQRLPEKNTYCGINGGGYASGCGRIFSRDVIKKLIDGLPTRVCNDEDALIGQYLRDEHKVFVNGTPERVQYNYVTHKIERCYHYRCKEQNQDKLLEMVAFQNIFNETCFSDFKGKSFVQL